MLRRIKKLGFSFSEPPPRLAVLLSGVEVAELTIEGTVYVFRYLPAFQDFNLAPIPGFPDLNKEYRSGRLWPFFAERIPDQRRPEIQEVIEREGLKTATTLQLLASLGAHSITDPFELRLSQAA
jgi:HipA-like protein